MKDLKERIKKLIASGEDPELVKKLEEVLAESEEPEDERQAEEVAAFVPEVLPVPPESLERLRAVQSQRAGFERALGQHYVNFEKNMKPLLEAIRECEVKAVEEQQKIVADLAPEGLEEEYQLSLDGEEGQQKLVVRRITDSSEEE